MTHIQLDDATFDHPKVLSVGKDAKLLFVASICYCGNRLTDGFVPLGAVAVLGAKMCVTKTKPAVEELIAAHLWDTTEGGYLVHDYLVYNASAEKVHAKQAAARDRMSQRRSQDVRANFAGTSQEVQEPTTTTTTTTTRSYEPNGSPEREDTPPPPSPGETKPKRTRSIKTPVPDDVVNLIPVDVWTEIGHEQQLTDEQLRFETSLMIDYYRGKGERRPDWVSTWRGWMRSPWRKSKPANPPARQLPPGFELPPGVRFEQLEEWVAYRKAGLSMPEERNVLVDAYLSALNGKVAA